MQRAESIATAYWGRAPCGGRVTVRWADLTPSVNSMAYWDSPMPATGDAQDNTNCRVVLNPRAGFTWPKLCTVVAHEYGHLLGHAHGADGPGVMSAVYHSALPGCAAAPVQGRQIR